jgi:hypothetical protein
MFVVDIIAGLIEFVVWSIVGISKLIELIFFPRSDSADDDKHGKSV